MGGRQKLWALGIALALLSSGCEDDCASVFTCDIRTPDCQRSVVHAVTCHRGSDSLDLPKVTVVSEKELLDRLEETPPTDQELAAAEYVNRGLALYQLAPQSYDVDEQRGDVAAETSAVYLPRSKEILVIDRGEALDDETALETLAHEVVHALQDADHELVEYLGRWARTYDAALAVTALIEGEAVLYQGLIAAQFHGRKFEDVEWDTLFDEWQRDAQDQAEQDESPVNMAGVRFPYAYGGYYVYRHFRVGGPERISALFKHPPQTTWEIVFGPSDHDAKAEQEMLAQHAVPELPSSFEEIASTSFGAWIECMFAARRGAAIGERWNLVQQTVSDVFAVQVDEQTDTVLASWRMRMFEGSDPRIWPNIDIGRLHGDTERREMFVIAADPELAAEANAPMWRPPSVDTSEDAIAGVAQVMLGRNDGLFCGRAPRVSWSP